MYAYRTPILGRDRFLALVSGGSCSILFVFVAPFTYVCFNLLNTMFATSREKVKVAVTVTVMPRVTGECGSVMEAVCSIVLITIVESISLV